MSDASIMPRCKTCQFFEPGEGSRGFAIPAGYGTCDRWLRGYERKTSDVPINGVLVEDDEGWGAIMGEEFGCVLHEPLTRSESPGPSI